MNAGSNDPVESLKDAFIAQGFFPHLTATRSGWVCELSNSLLRGRPPRGEGPLAREAMLAADEDRQKIEALIVEGDRTYVAPNPISY